MREKRILEQILVVFEWLQKAFSHHDLSIVYVVGWGSSESRLAGFMSFILALLSRHKALP